MFTFQYNDAQEIGERVRHDRDRLQANAQQQLYKMEAHNLAVEAICSGLSDLEQERKPVSSEAYNRKRSTLLSDIEKAEHDFGEVEEMYAEYLTAVENRNLAQVERVDAEIAQYEAELQEMQHRFTAVQADTERLKEQSLEAHEEALQAELFHIQQQIAASEIALGEQTKIAATSQAAPPTGELTESLKQLNLLRCENENKLHTLDKLLVEVKAAKILQEEVESKLQGLLDDARIRNNEEQEAQQKLEELVSQAEAEKLKLAQVLRTLDMLRADTDAATAQASAENARHADMRKSVLAFEQSNATISAALERVTRKVSALEAQHSDAHPSPEFAAAQAELQAVQKKLDSLSKARDAANQKIDETSAALKQMTAETETLKSEAATAKAKTVAAQQELKRQRSAAVARVPPSAVNYPPNIRVELSAQIVDLQKKLQVLDADSKTAEDMSHGLEALILQHSANIAQLEEQRTAHALEVRKKVTLAEHRRQFTQQERERVRKLGQELETADAVFRVDLQKINKELSLAEQALVEEYDYALSFMAVATVAKPAPAPEKEVELSLSAAHQRSWSTGRVSPSVFDFDINPADVKVPSYENGEKRTLPVGPCKAARAKPKKRARQKTKAEPAEKLKAVGMPEAQKAAAPSPVVKAPHRKSLRTSSLSQRSQEDWGWDEDDGSISLLRGTGTGAGPAMGVENVLNIGETHSGKTHVKPNEKRKKAQRSLPETW